MGFGIEEVITEYNILRDVLQDQAEAAGLNLTGKTGHIINRVLNAAMTLSIRAYIKERNAETRRIRQERLSFMMHDLKTPVSAIISAAAILEDHIPLERKGNIDVLQIIRRNAERMNGLLMRVIREESYLTDKPLVERQEVNLSHIVRSIFAEIKPLADNSETKLVNDVDEGMIVNADPALLAEVLQNLLSNAIRFTERGSISVGAQYKDKSIECWVQEIIIFRKNDRDWVNTIVFWKSRSCFPQKTPCFENHNIIWRNNDCDLKNTTIIGRIMIVMWKLRS